MKALFLSESEAKDETAEIAGIFQSFNLKT